MLEEKEAKIRDLHLGRGIEDREVDLFDRKEERLHDAFAMSIWVDGDDVYVAGYEFNSDDIRVIKYWKMGKKPC